MSTVALTSTGWVLILISTLLGLTSGQFRTSSSSSSYGSKSTDVRACPLAAAKKDFVKEKFLGDWYVQEYAYPKKMPLKDISCVGHHFSLTSFGDIMSNFTFRFPPRDGHFYHVPTFSLISEVEPSVWETQFKSGLKMVEIVTAIVDTDYDNWAIMVQCTSTPTSTNFLSTRVLSRSRNLPVSDWIALTTAMDDAHADAPFKYPVDQQVCEELDAS